MPKHSYAGRHRPAASKSLGRRIVVPIALLATTVTGGLVVREAGARQLEGGNTPAAVVAEQYDGMGGADPAAVDAAQADRNADGTARSSRDTSRDAATLVGTAARTADAKATAARAAAEKAAAAKAADAKAKAAAARAAKAAAEAREKAIAASHQWVSPFSGYTLTSGYGYRWGRMHPAQDLAAASGTPVRAMSTGTVISAGWSNVGYGYTVEIRYWDGTESLFAHNSRLLVSVGESVDPGEKVAYSGSTGNSTGPHLHLEIRPDGSGATPPRSWLADRGVYL